MGRVPGLQRRLLVRSRLAVQRTGFDVVREPFRYRFVHGLDLHGITCVLDIGANTGQFGAVLRRADYAGRIVSVEPLGDAFEALRTAVADDPAWDVERAAVSDRSGTLTVNVSGNSVSSSVLPILSRSTQAAQQTAYVGTEDVTATTVDELVRRHAIVPETSLLKIDVQGYERAVLNGADETLGRFAGVRCELSLVPLYDGQALLPELLDLLGRRGFELWYVEPGFTEPGTRRLLQFDGVFFRSGGGNG